MRTCSVTDRLLSLRALLPEAEFIGADDIRPLRCTSDSRRVRPGDLFAALPGDRYDGHQFIAEAIQRGATSVLCERPQSGLSVPCGVVPHVHHAYGRICQALAGNPSFKLKLIGITGSHGKTTTSCLIASVLLKAGYRVGVAGTLGYFDGQEVEPATHTTPPAETLAPLLARMVTNECTHAMLEVSNRALAQSHIAGLRLDVACVTNVSRDHLDDHNSLQDYRLAKSKLLDYLAPEGFAVVNADDAIAAGYLRHFHGPALTIGIRNPAEIMATPVEQFPSEQTFLLTAGSETVPVRTRMIGKHHIYNCLTATAVGLTYGLDLATVVRGLESVDYVPGRLQRIECGQPFSVFIDYAHTPDALASSLRALRNVTNGRLICVSGAVGDHNQPLMGRQAEKLADCTVLTSDNPQHEDPREIVTEILEGFQKTTATQVIIDRSEAIHWALAQAQPGDCLLIASNKRIALDDQQIAEDWLYAQAEERT
ncbi:MAG: UDP-N-acetylmuramoyl-L-alanyl-D-glutamate--2,6-diaminopimelate ligase [Planctomycetota bacterium]